MKRLLTIMMIGVALFCSVREADSAEGRIIVGIVPEVNLAKQLDRYAPLCKYLGKKIGIEVGVKPFAHYGLIYEEMRDGKIGAGFFGSFVYVMTHARIGIEPIARPVTPEGISTYAGYTFVRKDSGIRGPKDMKGKTIALVDPATTAGYIAQKEYLKKHGLDIDKDMKIFWAGSHDAALMAVMNKQADVGGAKNNAVNKIMKDNRAVGDLIAVLDESPKPPVPENALAVSKEMQPQLKEKIKKALLSMDKDAEGRVILQNFGASRFIETKDADYKSLYGTVKFLGIDLKTYSYKKQ
jgi:phosphonate transport system substrate-binding protein